MKSERKPFLLRLDSTLLAKLQRWATLDNRSLNGQIEHLLRQAVEDRTVTRRKDSRRD